MRESLEEDFVLGMPLPLRPALSPSVSTEGASLRVSNLRRGIMALEEDRAACRNRERLEGKATSDIVS